MALKAIEAKVECDGCGFIYHHDLDPAASIKQDNHDLVTHVDLMKYVEMHLDVIGDHHLCEACMDKVITKFPDNDNPTYDQVHKVVAHTI